MKVAKNSMMLGMLLVLCVLSNGQDARSDGDDSSFYRRGLTMITPAEQWREALPSGNGTIGALVFGSVGKERIVFNHNELWYRGNVADCQC